MNVQAIKCDICGRFKGETNSWWIAAKQGNSLIIYPSHCAIGTGVEMDLCGSACVHKAVDKFLSDKEAA